MFAGSLAGEREKITVGQRCPAVAFLRFSRAGNLSFPFGGSPFGLFQFLSQSGFTDPTINNVPGERGSEFFGLEDYQFRLHSGFFPCQTKIQILFHRIV
jgi:hypothetical protein